MTTLTAAPGLLLRPVRWPEEAGTLVEVNNAWRLAAGSLGMITEESILAYYGHLEHSDLATDLRIGELDGRPLAYVRVEWREENRGERVFESAIFRAPDAPPGAFAALLDWAVARHREILPSVPADGRGAVLLASTGGADPEATAELRRRGFRDVRFSFEMLRPSLVDVPDAALPAGLEVRPVEPAHLRRIFEAEVEAFAGHWGAGPGDGSEARWQEFLAHPFNRDTTLWQVAWEGEEVAGMVRPFINEEENRRQGVRRGWCENISTRAGWRGRGVASALICRALLALRERGMTEAALGVDALNETGALRLYEKMGFRPVFTEVEWRRRLLGGDAETAP